MLAVGAYSWHHKCAALVSAIAETSNIQFGTQAGLWYKLAKNN